uniref:Reverse transcriptase domain-containing protein n=1 Tax=Cannabis sativa TaxID=3483 RepID=A0A803QD49_CANSA
MKAMAWNCRGLGNVATVRQLKDLIRKSDPEIVILSKVKLSQDKFKRLMSRLHFKELFYVPPMGSARGLALCWKIGVLCSVEQANKNKIVAQINSDPPDRPWLLIDLNGTLKDNECLNYSRSNNIARYSFDLRRMVLRSGLIDLGFIGTRFTWFRRNSSSTARTSLKRARLDRVMGSADWRVNWPNAIVQHLHGAVSDHNPILLDTNGGRKCMKPQFKDEVQFRKLSVQIEEARANLKGVEESQAPNEEAHSEARKMLNEALAREKIFWRQKSRVSWLKDGDRATKFFMAFTVTRRRQNYIQILSHESGNVLDQIADIAKQFIDKFSNTFSISKPRTALRLEEWLHLKSDCCLDSDLNTIPTEDEIFKALCSMGIDKAPGPDGLPVAFFRSHWETIRPDFLKMIAHFFQTSRVPPFINDTNLVLIPKKENPSTMAFFKGRSISENTSVEKEIVHSMARRNGSKGFMMIKLDMEKVYDKMNWEFIKEALQFHGVSDPLLGWIMNCIEIKKMNLIINGSKQGTISSQCGLRQGDPLSPALFILVADLLSRLISDANVKGKIRGFKVARAAQLITHLMFADDVMLFGHALEKEAEAFLGCLHTYCEWSEQAVNFQKSTVFFL